MHAFQFCNEHSLKSFEVVDYFVLGIMCILFAFHEKKVIFRKKVIKTKIISLKTMHLERHS